MALLWAEARVIGFRGVHRFKPTTTRKVVCHELFAKCKAEWIHHSQRSLQAIWGNEVWQCYKVCR